MIEFRPNWVSPRRNVPASPWPIPGPPRPLRFSGRPRQGSPNQRVRADKKGSIQFGKRPKLADPPSYSSPLEAPRVERRPLWWSRLVWVHKPPGTLWRGPTRRLGLSVVQVLSDGSEDCSYHPCNCYSRNGIQCVAKRILANRSPLGRGVTRRLSARERALLLHSVPEVGAVNSRTHLGTTRQFVQISRQRIGKSGRRSSPEPACGAAPRAAPYWRPGGSCIRAPVPLRPRPHRFKHLSQQLVATGKAKRFFLIDCMHKRLTILKQTYEQPRGET